MVKNCEVPKTTLYIKIIFQGRTTQFCSKNLPIMNNCGMFTGKNLPKPLNFTSTLLVILVTFRRSDIVEFYVFSRINSKFKILGFTILDVTDSITHLRFFSKIYRRWANCPISKVTAVNRPSTWQQNHFF